MPAPPAAALAPGGLLLLSLKCPAEEGLPLEGVAELGLLPGLLGLLPLLPSSPSSPSPLMPAL